MTNEMVLRAKYTETQNDLAENLSTIRSVEALYQDCIVDLKVSRVGMKFLSRINDLYEHRMNNLVPENRRGT
ncbi:conserved hypothetical protein [Aeromonas phage 65]|uniref:Uncharacterized protein n=1 Tax=Aeromonas phage 65 TaxID=2919549 RepID=E5DS29_9CAUD|nr:hypothetical protein ST65p195 [Aeromonas phage 65]ADQ53203.1 conserved hypothetical protein [Aeromonas phage 65]